MSVNKAFFKIWSSETAYALGFFAADGSMYTNPGGSHYFSFYSNDRELFVKIRNLLSSDHKIDERKVSKSAPNQRYVLQIGSKSIYYDLLNLGMMRNKSCFLKFPCVPTEFLRDFVRGYLDGDGNILFKEYYRKDSGKHRTRFAIKFISGSGLFLAEMQKRLTLYAKIGKGSLFIGDRSYVLSYAMKDSRKLCGFMYNRVTKNLFLERKHSTYEAAKSTMGW